MRWSFCFPALTAVLLVASLFSEIPAQSAQPSYEGVRNCKPCHLSARSGGQFKVWQAGPHARAFKTLATARAKHVAEAVGISEPQRADACLRCHTTAFGVPAKRKGPKLTLEEGVSCEACHGPGSKYKGRKLMRDIYSGKVDGRAYGLIPPTEKVCKGCHNPESPTYKPFDYKKMVAAIAHPIPLQTTK